MQTAKLPFRTFKDAPAAEDLAEWLRLQGIAAEVSDTSGYFDPSFAHSILSREWTVRIGAEDFTKAGAELRHFYDQRLSSVPDDYYLFAFSDAELEEILEKPDEWGDLDYALARHILQTRGRQLPDEALQALRLARYEALSRPEADPSGGMVTWGYVLAVFAGFIGSLIGWHLMNGRKILPDGKSVPRYTAAAAVQGRRIFRLGIAVTLLYVLIRMYLSYRQGINGAFP